MACVRAARSSFNSDAMASRLRALFDALCASTCGASADSSSRTICCWSPPKPPAAPINCPRPAGGSRRMVHADAAHTVVVPASIVLGVAVLGFHCPLQLELPASTVSRFTTAYFPTVLAVERAAHQMRDRIHRYLVFRRVHRVSLCAASAPMPKKLLATPSPSCPSQSTSKPRVQIHGSPHALRRMTCPSGGESPISFAISRRSLNVELFDQDHRAELHVRVTKRDELPGAR